MNKPFAAVVGWPANHSLSPVMMRHWLDEAGIAGDYGRLEITPNRFESFCRSLPMLGWVGVNLTLPHKAIALELADSASEAAHAVGAANLLIVDEDGALRADNTDIAGIADSLAADVSQGPAVLAGAGGAAAAALHHLAPQSREIRLVNRTYSKAQALAARYDRPIVIQPDIDIALKGAALLVNATSLGMVGKPSFAPDLNVMAPNALVFDMVYTPRDTPLLRSARKAGRRPVDGLSMLIGQARPSFEAFFAARPLFGTNMREHLIRHLEADQ